MPLSSRFGIKNEQQPHRQSRRVDSAANRNKNSLYARILSFCASLLYSPTLSITYPPISPKISVHGCCIHSSASSQTIHIQPLIQPSSFASFCWHATTARRSKNVLMLCLGLCRRTYGPWRHRSQHAYSVLARPRRRGCVDVGVSPTHHCFLGWSTCVAGRVTCVAYGVVYSNARYAVFADYARYWAGARLPLP